MLHSLVHINILQESTASFSRVNYPKNEASSLKCWYLLRATWHNSVRDSNFKNSYHKFFSRKDIACYIHFFCFWVPLPFSRFMYIMNRYWFLFLPFVPKSFICFRKSGSYTSWKIIWSFKFKYPVRNLES